ncbi:CBS domain and Domain of unknown function DUF21 domain-containing protein [Strongyloides ratti]|uniref:CNNM transmembrane domain-containing protein n=1 Tax=Strongyloides ratti TaxID=34506 RepID=A0A090L5J7_STRRB|nr:CBS domain and Domain of unknown function DUF21 domain-containing protein [Strongyloides ratti]CEF65071.1 CBS domain and Domain of unknown function DUF21 domain-containing protein [Strongyloides ratti]
MKCKHNKYNRKRIILKRNTDILDTTPEISNPNNVKNNTEYDFKSNNQIPDITISGLRLQPKDNLTKSIDGYTNDGIPIVESKTEIKIVVFGSNLQYVNYIGFTITDNCNDMTVTVSKKKFINVTSKSIIFVAALPDKESIYRLCYHLSTSNNKYIFIKEENINISTKLVPKKYIMPLWIQILVIIFFAVLSGLFSGLNLGLMTLSPQELELITKSGSEQDKKYAEAVMPIRKSGNFLLCSLLIGNVLVNSAISILMDDLTSGIVALIASSAGIVIFGEIIPQSLCVKKGLAVGANTIWITKFFMCITFPVSYPLSKILDIFIGVEVSSYDRKKLMELIKMTTKGESAMEFKIAFGAMEITDKTVKDVMTKIEDVFMLSETTVLNEHKVTEIVNMGYTRIPVYANNDRNNVVNLLFIKDLALMDPDQNFTVKTVCSYNQHLLRFVIEDTPLKTMLEEFKKGEYHLAIVRKKTKNNNVGELCGLVTLEDILEEILKAEIIDETDVVIDNRDSLKRISFVVEQETTKEEITNDNNEDNKNNNIIFNISSEEDKSNTISYFDVSSMEEKKDLYKLRNENLKPRILTSTPITKRVKESSSTSFPESQKSEDFISDRNEKNKKKTEKKLINVKKGRVSKINIEEKKEVLKRRYPLRDRKPVCRYGFKDY